MLFLSLAVVVTGADLLVNAGVNLAKIFGISPWIIGITVFAIGTSLPELASSLTASFKKIPSISVSNIVGSNIINIFLGLGVVAIIRPIIIKPSSILTFEFPVLMLFSLFLFWFVWRGKITRIMGYFLLLGYIAFIGRLIIR